MADFEPKIVWLVKNNEQALVSIGNICSCRCTVYHNGKAKVMMIDDVRTREGFRHQGYAKRLLASVVETAKKWGVDSVELVVNRDNEAARNLYEKSGFAVTDKLYYRMLLNKWPT